jgi:type I restriction enzyme S subunit
MKMASFWARQIPVPSLDDQIRIAHLLGKVEALIAQRKQHLQQLDDLLKSVFLEMFGDPVRNEKGWRTSPLEDFCDAIIDCPHSTPQYADANTGYFCVRSSDIVDGYLVLSNALHVTQEVYEERIARYRPALGDIIYSREGGRLGNAARIVRDASICLGQRMMLFKVNANSTAEFLWALLESAQFKAKLQGLVGGGAAPRVNIKDLKKIVVAKPSPQLQVSFAILVKKVDSLRGVYERSLIDLEALYGVLSQCAFKGELNLSRVPLPDDQGGVAHGKQGEQTEQLDRLSLPRDTLAPTEITNHLVQAAQPLKRGELLARWFNRYLTNTLPDAKLGSAQFLEAAWQTLQQTQLESDGETPALALDDYDVLKELIFKALDSEELNQIFDDDNNRVALRLQKRPDVWGSW